MGVIILSITPLLKYVSAKGWEASTLSEAYTENMTDMEQAMQVVILFIVNFICGLTADVVEGHQLARTKQMVSCIILNDSQKAALSATEKAVLINKGWTLA